MAECFLKYIVCEKASWLRKTYPNAYLLLSLIAERARRVSGLSDGLELGECFIGDFATAGIESEQKYRTAKQKLFDLKIIEKVETCRNRKKSTTAVTTVGTKVKLIDSSIWNINLDKEKVGINDLSNDRPTTDQRPTNDESRKKKKDISNDISNEEEARRAARPRLKDLLLFNFEKWEFEGINQKDLDDWKLMYPHLNLHAEIVKAANWLKSNPSKSNKKNWRKYLTGWLGRANDSIENKKAYRTASGSFAQDRSTRDIHGNPVVSIHEGRF